MKKFIALFACFCLILTQFSITAFAVTAELSYDYKESSGSISGHSTSGDYIDIIVFRTGDDMLPENCIHVNQVECDENGDYSLNFTVPAWADSGEYTVYISGKDKVVHTKTFVHNNVANILAGLKSATTVEEFKAVLVGGSDVFSEELVAARDEILEMMLGASFETIADYEKHFVNMTNLYKFGTSQPSEMKDIYDANATDLGLTVLDAYDKLDDKTNVFSVAKQEGFDVKNITSVNNALKVGVVFTLLKDGGAMELDTLVKYIKDNYGLLGITQATAENDELAEAVKSMLGKNISTTEKFAEELDEAFDELGSKGGSSSGRPSSGGGGGGSSKSGSGKVPLIVAPSAKPEQKSFTDLGNVSWAAEAINGLANLGIVSGVSDTEFNPEANVTREQFVKMLVLALGISTDGSASEFADIPASHWSHSYVSAAVSVGVVNGVGNGNFGAGQNITRQDMAVMLYRAASVSRIALTEKTSVSFGDEAQIAGYAKSAVDTMSKAGIINGSDGMFMPKANATRAQAAKMIYEILKLKGGV